MKRVAIIPARGGSKRIPRKNIRNFLGRPMIEYSIEAALGSELFDLVIVSTDDGQIAEIARSAGAQVPFMRSAKAADDHATTADVLVEVLSRLEEDGQYDLGCCIYPTAPFVTAARLREAAEIFENSDADRLLPVTRFSYPILRSLSKDGEFVRFTWPEYALTRSQDLAPAFHDAGQFYFFDVGSMLKTRQLMTDATIGMEIPSLETQDIDEEADWHLAELKYRQIHGL